MEPTITHTVWVSFLTSVVTWLGIEFLLKPWIRPKLTAEYDPSDQFCRMDYLAKHGAIWHRLRVMNVRRASAKIPRVYLMNVEVSDGDNLSPSDYRDGPLPLAWAYEASPEEHMPIKPRQPDLPLLKDTPDYADICVAKANGVATLGLLVDPYKKYANLIEKNKTYRLTVQAVAEDADPVKYCMDLKWDGTASGLQLTPVRCAGASSDSPRTFPSRS
jgi:hypothetical protein